MYFYKFYNSIQIFKKIKYLLFYIIFLKYEIKFKFNFIFIWELFMIFQVSLICVWVFIARWSTESSTDIFIRGNHLKLLLKFNDTMKNYYILLLYLYFILLYRYDGKKILLLENHLDFYILGGGKHYIMFYILLK